MQVELISRGLKAEMESKIRVMYKGVVVIGFRCAEFREGQVEGRAGEPRRVAEPGLPPEPSKVTRLVSPPRGR